MSDPNSDAPTHHEGEENEPNVFADVFVPLKRSAVVESEAPPNPEPTEVEEGVNFVRTYADWIAVGKVRGYWVPGGEADR